METDVFKSNFLSLKVQEELESFRVFEIWSPSFRFFKNYKIKELQSLRAHIKLRSECSD